MADKEKKYSLTQIRRAHPELYANDKEIKKALVDMGYLNPDLSFKQTTEISGISMKEFKGGKPYLVYNEEMIQKILDYFADFDLSIARLCQRYGGFSQNALMSWFIDHGMAASNTTVTEKGKNEYYLKEQSFYDAKRDRTVRYLAIQNKGIKRLLDEKEQIAQAYAHKQLEGLDIPMYKKLELYRNLGMPEAFNKSLVLFCAPIFGDNYLKEVTILDSEGDVLLSEVCTNVYGQQKKDLYTQILYTLEGCIVVGPTGWDLRNLEVAIQGSFIDQNDFGTIARRFLHLPKPTSIEAVHQTLFNESANIKCTYDMALAMLKCCNALEKGPYLPLDHEKEEREEKEEGEPNEERLDKSEQASQDVSVKVVEKETAQEEKEFPSFVTPDTKRQEGWKQTTPNKKGIQNVGIAAIELLEGLLPTVENKKAVQETIAIIRDYYVEEAPQQTNEEADKNSKSEHN